MKHCLLQINAPSRKEAERIIDKLLEKHLIAGANIIETPSRYWWKGKIESHKYYSILAYSLSQNKEKIITETRQIHSDETPAIVFWGIDANNDFLEWIQENCRKEIHRHSS